MSHLTSENKYSANDYHALATTRNFTWIADAVPRTSHTKTMWRCTCGYEWASSFQNVRANRGCPKCGGKVRITTDDYHALASQKGFEWIGDTLPLKANADTLWRCSNGHDFTSTYSRIRSSGEGCIYCGGTAPLTPADYHALAVEHGLEWVGKETAPRRSNTTRWRCPEGHEWNAAYGNIKSRAKGAGCPYCSGHVAKTAGDYADLANELGYIWLGAFPKTTHHKTNWQCPKGHTWDSTYQDVRDGHGCPHCLDMVNGIRVSVPQRAIAEMIGGELNYRADKYFIDVALVTNGARLAIEYDCWYWHKDKDETRRDSALLSMGWRLLHIRTNLLLPTQAQLDAAIAELLNGATYAEITLPDWGGL